MSDNVPGPAGSLVIVEDITQSDATVREMPVAKLHTGGANEDLGPATSANPFPTSDEPVASTMGAVLDELKLHTQILLAIDAKLAEMSGELPFEEE